MAGFAVYMSRMAYALLAILAGPAFILGVFLGSWRPNVCGYCGRRGHMIGDCDNLGPP